MISRIAEINPQRQAPDAENMVIKIKVMLDGQHYFAPNGAMAVALKEPLTPMFIERCYSEVFDTTTKELVAIQRHEFLRIFNTGLSAELVKPPSWWEKRDQGSLA